MLCPNKRDLYYNETKLQMELGVLESDDYYNANVGGMRFYRPVNSYITMDVFKGVKNPAYRGSFYIIYENGIEEHVEDKTVKQWCRDINYGDTGLHDLRSGKIKRHKNIISMEYQSERT